MLTRIWERTNNITCGLLTSLTMLNMLDFYFTAILINKYGIDIELNPLMHYLVTSTGNVYSILYIKLIILSIIWGATLHVLKGKSIYINLYTYMFAISNVIYIAIVVWGGFLLIHGAM